ncbi:MAG: hypothetical protein SGI71_05915 [Verrucomicrobiota bacterium]|nr:hypothetical protein [Verrucomicrobiota bacterium]
MNPLLKLYLWLFLGLYAFTLFLTFCGKGGKPGHALAEWMRKAPVLDWVVAILTWVPWVIGGYLFGCFGFLISLGAGASTLILWVFTHELLNAEWVRGPRIVKTLNTIVGRWRNHVALWFSLLAIPVFWSLRLGQILLYPPICWMLGFPKYKSSDWISVSRHKFEGLIGHDLIWCLYCDWMTGVFSFAGELLRNVESFFCPIRFYDGKKCENCKLDFPDIVNGWVSEKGTMKDAVDVVEKFHSKGNRSWFGHPSRRDD